MGLCRLFSLPILLSVSILILGTTTSGSCYKQYSFVPDNSSSPLGIAPTSDPKTVAFAYGYGGQIYTANGHRMGTVAVPNYPIPPLPVGQFAWNDHIVTSGYYDELMAVVNGTVVLLKDLDPNSTHPTYPRAFSYAPEAGGIVFIASAQGRAGIWLTDGTADGTRLLHELPPTDHPYFLNYWVQEVADLGIFAVMPGGDLYFYDVETDTMYDTPLHVFSAATYFELASTGDRLVIGMQGEPMPLWSSDGTEEGTIPIGSSYVTYTLTSAPGKVYFAASSAEEGVELWQTDGTAKHTKMVPRPAIPGPTGSDPRSHTLVVIGDRLYFSALTQEGSYQVHMLRLRS